MNEGFWASMIVKRRKSRGHVAPPHLAQENHMLGSRSLLKDARTYAVA
jgi:hypothetical protein